MKNIILFLCLIISFNNCKEIVYNHSINETNLYFILTSFRHGARTTNVKNDVFKNIIKNRNKLTSYGAKQHLIIGQKYRKRYFNFLNLKSKKFDISQLYIRSSDISRTKISTIKQLQGLIGTKINSNFINFINIRHGNGMKLYYSNNTEFQKMKSLFKSCQLRKLTMNSEDFIKKFKDKVLPIFEKCYEKLDNDNIQKFCENTISAFFEYKYNNQKNNKIGKCGFETAKIFYDFCINYYDSERNWSERWAYLFYLFFKDIFKNMENVIKGVSNLKMIMIGGHDSTVAPLMDFFDGMNIIKRTEYPHFAFNIVFELRKYSNQFYLEIYYNDILKYNQTIEKFKNILDNSKYVNFDNYCRDKENDKNNIIIKNENLKLLKNRNNKIYIWVSFLYIIWVLYLINYFIKKRRLKNDNLKEICNNVSLN